MTKETSKSEVNTRQHYYDNGQLKEKITPTGSETFYTDGNLNKKYLRGELVESYSENGNPR